MSISKTLMRGLCAAAGALAMAGVAHADTTWNLTGTFNDGGSLTGTITLNQYGFLYDNYTVTTTAGSLQSGFTYTSADSFFSNSTTTSIPAAPPFYIDFQPGYEADLHLEFSGDPLTSAPTDLFVGGYQGPSFECQNSYSCYTEPTYNPTIRYLTSGEATLAVPEPASWALMIVGLGGIGGALRFNRRKPAVATA